VDTVVDFTLDTVAAGNATGFLFRDMTPESFLAGIRRVVDAYHDKPNWQRLQLNGMTRDFSWRSSAAAYREIYLSLSSASPLSH
jgi:starch synthase